MHTMHILVTRVADFDPENFSLCCVQLLYRIYCTKIYASAKFWLFIETTYEMHLQINK